MLSLSCCVRSPSLIGGGGKYIGCFLFYFSWEKKSYEYIDLIREIWKSSSYIKNCCKIKNQKKKKKKAPRDVTIQEMFLVDQKITASFHGTHLRWTGFAYKTTAPSPLLDPSPPPPLYSLILIRALFCYFFFSPYLFYSIYSIYPCLFNHLAWPPCPFSEAKVPYASLLTTVKIVGFSVNLERTFGTMKEGSRKQGAPSPCAACKLLRRRCAQDCVFAPYFPADEPQKFANVHKVFGASNVNKMLQVGSCLPLLFNLYSAFKVFILQKMNLRVCLEAASWSQKMTSLHFDWSTWNQTLEL